MTRPVGQDTPVQREIRALRVLASTLGHEDPYDQESVHRAVTWAMGDPKRLDGLVRAAIDLTGQLNWGASEVRTYADSIERPFVRPRRIWTGINAWHWESRSGGEPNGP